MVEYLLFLFRAEFAFVSGGKWVKRVLWLVGDMVVAEAGGWLLVTCELWWFSTESGGGEVGGECPLVDTGVRSTGFWWLAVTVVLVLFIGVGKTHYGLYLLVMCCFFLLFVGRVLVSCKIPSLGYR